MANLAGVLNEHIRRLARREGRGQLIKVKKATARYRREIAALKRLATQLAKRVAFLEKAAPAKTPAAAVPGLDKARFRADGLRAHRAKLGLSAKNYGKLVGVSGLTVYHWEHAKSRPRKQQLAGLVAVRGMGKREALRRLELLGKR